MALKAGGAANVQYEHAAAVITSRQHVTAALENRSVVSS